MVRAQEMSDSVLLQIYKMVSDFAWNKQGTTPSNRSIMSATIAEEGMQVLGMKMRNNVIEIMKLKWYLRFDVS